MIVSPTFLAQGEVGDMAFMAFLKPFPDWPKKFSLPSCRDTYDNVWEFMGRPTAAFLWLVIVLILFSPLIRRFTGWRRGSFRG